MTPWCWTRAGRDGQGARKRAAFRAADVALAASGTVSLELAASSTPMVIAYRVNWLTFRIVKAIALVDTVTLVNLVTDTRVIPEFLGPDCTAEGIARGAGGCAGGPRGAAGSDGADHGPSGAERRSAGPARREGGAGGLDKAMIQRPR